MVHCVLDGFVDGASKSPSASTLPLRRDLACAWTYVLGPGEPARQRAAGCHPSREAEGEGETSRARRVILGLSAGGARGVLTLNAETAELGAGYAVCIKHPRYGRAILNYTSAPR